MQVQVQVQVQVQHGRGVQRVVCMCMCMCMYGCTTGAVHLHYGRADGECRHAGGVHVHVCAPV